MKYDPKHCQRSPQIAWASRYKVLFRSWLSPNRKRSASSLQYALRCYIPWVRNQILNWTTLIPFRHRALCNNCQQLNTTIVNFVKNKTDPQTPVGVDYSPVWLLYNSLLYLLHRPFFSFFASLSFFNLFSFIYQKKVLTNAKFQLRMILQSILEQNAPASVNPLGEKKKN